MALWCFFLCVMFFSCEMYDVDYNDYHTSVEADCDDSVYDKNEGIYKGEIFLVRDVRFPYGDRTYDSVDVRLGNHVNKELEIMELPVKSLFDRYEDRKLLADIPSWVLEKKINITFKYKLYFNILYELPKEGEVVDIDIDSIISDDFSDSRGSIEIDYHHRIYADSVYNEDKTQKLKFDVNGSVYLWRDEDVMNLMQKIVREQKRTLVMVTHDNHLASYADRIFHIIDGKIVRIEEKERMREEKHE